jgi:hypothetical protein
MPATKDPTTELAETGPRWPMLIVTGLLAAGVVFIIAPTEPLYLKGLAQHRADLISHPVTRDIYPSIAFFRDLDTKLPPNARVFFSGIIGQEKVRRVHFYYFARTYLFPRDVEISLDHQAEFHGWFAGVDCTSPDELRSNSFDVMLSVEKDGKVSVLPLTEKGKLNP